MHNSWDENYQRGYEWWLMVEAKKVKARNQKLKVLSLGGGVAEWLRYWTREVAGSKDNFGNYVPPPPPPLPLFN